ncbi:ABC transporter ATP-binding protein [Pseudobacteriovorax antillogorgiicola]|uniref:ABC-2 type transport system ATP-binding protein n=1 Tax=Pseudobacteriovorax antillogorgiicola TaxID=1513793 RepID=A0A1Y6C4X0_9BACT|nr:ABC transporter ATP-binding protein [Pseudobacteriovorax antillogorgiicola]TCS49834.1 ABC-2 type transport system ATP-binding protein [Pseudobacteriovorax antillogorgiicola]SMF43406.1 ABC-2 type transport system ATP-binding protein [Pseudobacteriovorax antillogorgiicola]
MSSIIEIENLSKSYQNGFQALKKVNLNIKQGEIFALLGPNGAGKTTLISIICGIVNATDGTVRVGGHHIAERYKEARRLIGLVPQELTADAFETVWNTVRFSRGLFGKKKDDNLITQILKDLSLWDKRDSKLMMLSGGMKRRVMIAKALSHEPRVLFLDEPTAGVDVELRKSMWELVRKLREQGVTIILTTHYIEEAEEMADRIGVIREGELILTEEKHALMSKLGAKQLTFSLVKPLSEIPSSLSTYDLSHGSDDQSLVFSYDQSLDDNKIPELLTDLQNEGIRFKDLNTKQSSLEEIFVGLVQDRKQAEKRI